MAANSPRRRRRAPLLVRGTDLIAFLAGLDLATRRAAVEMLTYSDRLGLDADWPSWAHDGQEPPVAADGCEAWRTWVIVAGRGFGKTRAGAEWVIEAARGPAAVRIALVGATIDDARRVMVEGQSGLLSVAAPWIESWTPSFGRLRFTNGSEATLFSGASPEALRGPEHHFAWCDELAKWRHGAECWAMLQLGLRLGSWPRVVVTTTPRCGSALSAIIAAPGCVVSGGPTRANPHLPPAFVDTVTGLYAGTRRGREELDGEIIADRAGALWTRATIEKCRVEPPIPTKGTNESVRVERSRDTPRGKSLDVARDERSSASTPFLKSTWPIIAPPPPDPTFRRTVIGVDPPAEAGTCGIVLCALDWEGIGHVLGDYSLTDVSPSEWADRVAAVARLHPDTLVVAEVNQGGRMVQEVLRAADPALRLKLVRAHEGKSARAEPVAMLFEQGKVRLHGELRALEAELMGMIAGGGYDGPGRSPDRADAMVWALSELLVRPKREPRVIAF